MRQSKRQEEFDEAGHQQIDAEHRGGHQDRWSGPRQHYGADYDGQ
jgi:hypothetical protein